MSVAFVRGAFCSIGIAVNLDAAAIYLSNFEGPYLFRLAPPGSRRNAITFPPVSAIAGRHGRGMFLRAMSLVATALQHMGDG